MNWGHLTHAVVIDAAEGHIDPATRQHLAGCDRCRTQVAAMAAAIGEIRGLEVPEPSPLFWNHLSDRVRAAIEGEPVPANVAAPAITWKRALPWAVPIAVAAALIVAVISGGGPGRHSSPAGGAPSIAAALSEDDVPEAPDSADWDLLVAVSDTLPDADGPETTTLTPGAANLAVASLSNDERVALARLLHDELRGPVL